MQFRMSSNGPIPGSGPTVLLVGSPARFSDRLLSIFADEFADHQFVRVNRITDLGRASTSLDGVEVLVFDESYIGAMLAEPRKYLDLASGAQIAIAFSHVSVAARFLAARNCHPGLEGVGLLPLNAQIEVWISVMRLLICGHVYLPQALMGDFPASDDRTAPTATMADDENSNLHNLTPREWEVLRLVATGRQNKVIANELTLSEHTVKLHIHNVLRKLGLSNRTLATRWYHQIGAAVAVGEMQHRG